MGTKGDTKKGEEGDSQRSQRGKETKKSGFFVSDSMI
jgi:hypothetical protein